MSPEGASAHEFRLIPENFLVAYFRDSPRSRANFRRLFERSQKRLCTNAMYVVDARCPCKMRTSFTSTKYRAQLRTTLSAHGAMSSLRGDEVRLSASRVFARSYASTLP
jgi:hypothetical protein